MDVQDRASQPLVIHSNLGVVGRQTQKPPLI